MRLHVFLGAEDNGAGGTGFGTGRLLPDGYPVGTQGALICLVVFLGNTRNIEGAAGNAITAAYAVFFVKIDNAVVVLNNGARRRTSLKAARVFAVHATVFTNQIGRASCRERVCQSV